MKMFQKVKMLNQLKLLFSFLIEPFSLLAHYNAQKDFFWQLIFSVVNRQAFPYYLPFNFIVTEIEEGFLILQEVHFESSKIKGVFQDYTTSTRQRHN